MTSTFRHVLVAIAIVAVGAGCSFGDTPNGVAEELIEGQLAEEYGLGEIDAVCEVPPNSDEGTTFTCTADAEIGLTRWGAEMISEDTVQIRPLNLLNDEEIGILEEAAIVQLGVTIDAENMDCGVGPILLADDLSIPCALTDPTTGDVFDATVQITDLETGGLEVQLSDTPR